MRALVLAASLLIACNAATPALAQPASAIGAQPSPKNSPTRPKAVAAAEAFEFGVYSPTPELADTFGRAGFTLLGPTFHVRDDSVIELARARSLGAIVSVGVLNADRASLSTTSRGDFAELVRDQVLAAADSSEVRGWYVLPEELRPSAPTDLAYLADVTATIAATDPKRRDTIAYVPNHYTAAAITPIAEHVDIIAKGTYTNHSDHMSERGWVRWSAQQLLQGVAPHEAKPWVVLEMFAEPPPDSITAIPRWVAHDVYASIIAGARGVLVYSGWPRDGFVSREVYISAYADVVTQLSTDPGRSLVGGVIDPELQATIDIGPKTITFRARKGESVELPSITFAARRVGDGRCIWVVNSAAEMTRVRLGPFDSAAEIVAPVPESAARSDSGRWILLPIAAEQVRWVCVDR